VYGFGPVFIEVIRVPRLGNGKWTVTAADHFKAWLTSRKYFPMFPYIYGGLVAAIAPAFRGDPEDDLWSSTLRSS
jgi:hypothetical protein